MPYAKIVNRQLVYAPYEIYTEDGKVIELNTREKCLEHGYREVFPHNKPPTDMIFVEYELRVKNEEEVNLSDLEWIIREEW